MTHDYSEVIELAGILSYMRELHDSHGEKVADRVAAMCEAMHLPADQARLIVVGAHLHDIGKLLIPSTLLNLDRKLTAEERAQMQTHTLLDWAAVQRAGYDQIIQDIAHHHQEKWDGSGYPIGLKGELIPLPARIVSICDVYEALTSRRPYRQPLSHEEAKALMRTLRGKDFEPRLLDLFFEQVAVEGAVEVVE